MPHDELRFDLVNRVHGHADDNQQRCPAKIEIRADSIQDESGMDRRQKTIDPIANQRKVM